MENGNLSSITTTPRGTYNSDYKVSTIANDYSLDLNTLAQWIDDRENYTTVMNTFGQMAGILGKEVPIFWKIPTIYTTIASDKMEG